MKITHICTMLEGGAGLAAARIIRSTRAMGINARVLVANGESSENVDVIKPVIPYSKIWLIKKIQCLLNIKRLWPKPIKLHNKIVKEFSVSHTPGIFTSPVTLYKSIVNHPWVCEADIVHLHWIGDFIDYESFFPKVNKPIVWTIQDENPGLGGFHYQMWKDQAPISFKAFDDELSLIKEKAYKNVKSMTLVAPSTMMKDFFINNRLLSRFPITIIHNGFEEENYSPISTACAREALHLPLNSNVFLFVAQHIYESRKGLKELIKALETINTPNSVLICLGNFTKLPESSLEIRCEGFVGNNRLQSLYYSAADYFVMPSYQEAFAQTSIEAMACGTPVVSFPCSGVHDLINKENGVICEDFTVDALVKGIKLAMSRNYDRKAIREDVINRFSYNKIAKQYLELYETILSNKNETLHHNHQL